MRKNPNNSMLVALLLAALLLPGCSKSQNQAPPAPAAPATAAKPAPAANAPVLKPTSSATRLPASLDFSKRTDPFKPFVAAPPPQAKTDQQPTARPAEDQIPIQSFEVSKFKVSGIIAGLNENRALVLDPNGKPYVIQSGMLIGNNNGRVSRITASGVEVVETFRDERGKTKKRTIVLTLAKKR